MQAVVPSPAPPSAPAATAPPATPTAARDDELTTLAIARDEDMATLHSRLERAADRRLLLALASDARVLRRPLDFRILGRLAEGLGLELVIATVDPRRRRLAKEHGFAVRALPRESRWQPRSSVIAGLFATVFMLAVAAMGLPRTSVTLSPGVAPITEETTLTVDLRPGAPGVASGWIGGKTLAVTFDVEQTIPTSGKETATRSQPGSGAVQSCDPLGDRIVAQLSFRLAVVPAARGAQR
jgi:hypothetical protein